jgi:hypothetical protein
MFLKKFALLLGAVLFLGSVEVSAYAASADLRLSLHNHDPSHAIDATDELFVESGEERDGESLSDVCLVTEAVPLPSADFVAEKISGTVLLLESSFVFSPQNSRAPPRI